MFKIATDPKFKATVNFKEPVGTDSYAEKSFVAEYRIVPGDVMTSIVEEKTDNEIMSAVICNIEGVTDDSGNELFVDDGLVDILKKIPYVRTAVIETYFNMVNGRGALEKNS